ncbi:hypothetical protein Ahy_A02g006240 [Arachis hypogaea]|uniref:Uncharacterized protein n=1 Tax=Arachis hypogaea TaxID=3818 RepID=A0A445E953_ARAHY|nr:hypothetical protein Ahy_A02g006240 [Arachis hypogaea]
MLEVGACMDKAKFRQLVENRDDKFANISFEELLAQEKKDSFSHAKEWEIKTAEANNSYWHG